MVEQLKYLVQLQILEDRKAKLIQSYRDTPRRIADLEKEFESFESVYLAKKAELEHARKLHRSLEQEIADLENRFKRSKARMNEVKTNKEYQAMLKEMEDLRKEIRGKEDNALELMETIESLTVELKGLGAEVDKRKKRLDQDKKILLEENEKLKERLERLAEQQNMVREKIAPDLLKRSEILIQKQSGIAVAPVENGVCQVCHLNIPPQKFIELQRDETILQCPHCHRFIYWPGHEAYGCAKDEVEEL